MKVFFSYLRDLFVRRKLHLVVISIFHWLPAVEGALAWPGEPIPPGLRRPNPWYPQAHGLFNSSPRAVESFLVNGKWVEHAHLGEAGQEVLDLLIDEGEMSESTLGFFFPGGLVRTNTGAVVRAPSELTVGTMSPVITRNHELGHLWIHYARKTYGLPEISQQLEESILVGSQLTNPRRLAFMSPSDISNQRLYMAYQFIEMSDDEVKRIATVLPKYSRRAVQLLSKSTDFGRYYHKRFNGIYVRELDNHFMAGGRLRRGLPEVDVSAGPLAVFEALSSTLDVSGGQVSTLGARHEHLGLVVAGALVSNLGRSIFPFNHNDASISLKDAMMTSTFSSKDSQAAAEVLIGRDDTLAGHMHSESVMNTKVGYHPSWCRYSCSAGCPNSYERPSLPWRLWHNIVGPPGVGSAYDRRIICDYPLNSGGLKIESK